MERFPLGPLWRSAWPEYRRHWSPSRDGPVPGFGQTGSLLHPSGSGGGSPRSRSIIFAVPGEFQGGTDEDHSPSEVAVFGTDESGIAGTTRRAGDDIANGVQYGQAFISLCRNVVAQPLVPCGKVSLLPPAERRRLLVDFQSRHAAPAAVCFHDFVMETALSHPASPALIDDQGQWSYLELNHRSNQLAAYLRSLGVRAGVVVAIYLPTCREAYLGMLGVSKAGGAFLPLRVSD